MKYLKIKQFQRMQVLRRNKPLILLIRKEILRKVQEKGEPHLQSSEVRSLQQQHDRPTSAPSPSAEFFIIQLHSFFN